MVSDIFTIDFRNEIKMPRYFNYFIEVIYS